MVSVIIPTYNEAKLIVSTLQQFQSLRGRDVEVIICDDGSTDNTVHLAQPLADRVLLNTAQHLAIGANRNRGANQAQGDIFLFCDADVRLPQLAGLLITVKTVFNEQPKLVGLTLPAKIYAAEERWYDRLWLGLRNVIISFQNNIVHLGAASGECQIVRASAFRSIHGYHPLLTTSEDHDLFVRLSKIGLTKMIWQYWLETSPRRFRQDGWAKVIWQWTRNYFDWFILKHVNTKPWEERR